MIKDIILQHKKEKEELISKKYVMRERVKSARQFVNNDLIKVIMGPRRAGKSVFAFLLLRDIDFAYLNFDDENILRVENYDIILRALFEVYPRTKFIFFDEIQNLKNWELFVNKLHRRGYNLILTGSNANLLSKELATTLTGRYAPIEVFPFNYSEFLRARNFEPKKEDARIPEIRGKILNYTDEYLQKGGFPEVIIKNLDPKSYLGPLFDSILLKDVVKRYNVRFSQELYDLALYLVSNFSSKFSFTRLRTVLNFRSTKTLQNYLNYLEEAYLVITLNRFSFKMQEQIKTPRKIYLADNGFIAAKSFQTSQNYGRLIENLVLGEFLKRGFVPNKNIFYYETRNQREIDFILKEERKITCLVQVAYQTSDFETQKRETRALIEASEELKCDNLLIITGDEEKEEKIKGKTILYQPLWKWLLEK